MEEKTKDIEQLEQENEAQAEEKTENQHEEQVHQETEEKDELTEAKERIAELEAKLDEAENKILRAQADFDNYRRRVRLDQEAAQKYRAQSLISDLLPALDNFDRALQIKAEDEQTKSLLQGMEMVYRQFLQALEKEGLEKIEAVGKEFDPTVHQAVMQVEDEKYDSNIVVEELQKGYKLKDRVIRPTMVKVNQ
ncbi:nucleotide exchange factor GrpE [Bacillus sp. FJAT-47783]|uniref:nucleotide exchange factor GrpE n=1 Tax=Bacillus sp. FJAT-47783 TaxID=2922712 RepID=UPI001FACFCA8|nr:nucleotide exchange factor GrpE [Bacillus sp. FJAT-47783]